MKRLLVVLGLLIVLAILGFGVFLATFDADRYRPLLVSKLQAALERPVRLQRLSLRWRGGVAVTLRGLAIEQDARAGGEPLVQMESATAIVRVLPLLSKEVRIVSVILTRPRVHVSRDAEGRVNLLGLAALAGPSAASGRTQAAGETAVSFNVGSVRIGEGTLHWTDAMTTPPTDLWLKALDVTVTHRAPGEPMDVSLRGAFAGERQNLKLSGRVTPPGAGQAGSIERMTLTMERVPLELLLPPAPASSPQLRGVLTVKLQGSASTLDGTQLARSISGDGEVQLAEPVIANLNLLRAVFEKFSMIPGLVEKLEAGLPPEDQAKLAARDTTFAPITLSVRCESGTLRFDDLRLRTDAFGLSGSGTVGVDGAINIRARLRIEPSLSAALVKSVKELQALTDAEGAMEIPVAIQGLATQVAVVPDLRYVASKVLVTKAVDLLGELMQRRQPAAEGAPPAGQPEPTNGDLLGQLLKRALKKKQQ